MYIIETQKVLDLKINLMASYVIIPQMGFYNPKHNLIILDLGHFQVTFGHILFKLSILDNFDSMISEHINCDL